MEYFDTFLFIIEIVSITSFGVSSSVTAIKKGLDVFGVVIVALTTAIGGGILRDLVLGIHPPKSFVNPSYAIVVALTSLATFTVEYFNAKKSSDKLKGNRFTDSLLFWLDTIGVAIFTMIGISTAYDKSPDYNAFLLAFVGVVTGVGGGVMRDIMVGNRPYIFIKHFYATACVIGSIVCIILWGIAGRIIAMLSGMAVIMILRFLAAKYRWNMPKVKVYDVKD